MEFRELKYIYTIAKCGSLSKAAKELYITQPSLSQFLKNYEEQLGAALFLRTCQGLKLTYAGEIYIEMIKKFRLLQRDMEQRLYDASTLQEGHITFAISPYRAPYLLPDVLSNFQKRYPGIKVKITEASMIEQEGLLLNGEVDIGLLSPPLKSSAIATKPLIEEEILLVGHENFDLIKKAHSSGHGGRPWIDIKDIIQYPCLLYSTDHCLRRFAEMLFIRSGCHPQIVQFHNSFETIIRLAEAGMGLTFLPETYIDTRSTLTYFSIGKMGEFRSLVLGFPPQGYISAATEAFVNVVTQALASQKCTDKTRMVYPPC